MHSLCLALALLSTFFAPRGAAQDGRVAFERALDAAIGEHATRLAEHAAWCQEQQLFGARHAALRAVLEVDPDHAEARRELGYRRAKDGTWTPPRSPRTPKDRNDAAQAEAAVRLGELGLPLRETLLGLLERHESDLDAAKRRAAIQRVLVLMPDDGVLRTHVGESFDRGAWVLDETVRARRTRLALRARIRELSADPGTRATKTLPTERELALGAFKEAWETRELRVLTTDDARHAQRVATALTVARPLIEALFVTEARFHEDATVFLLPTPEAGRAFLARHPALDDAQRAAYGALEGSGIEGTGDIAAWADLASRRMDSAVRLGLAWLFYDAHEVWLKHGMLFEGLGLYLTRELIGTRLTWFVQPSQYERSAEDLALRAHLLASGTNWMNGAHALLAQPTSPKLPFLVGKETGEMTVEDMLVAYVAAAYLLEGWPAELPGLLHDIGKGGSPHDVFEAHLGYTIQELDVRMRRWLGERR